MTEVSEWAPLVHDDEAGAVAKIVDALAPLDDHQRHRVLEWARDRYDNPMDKATTILLDKAKAATDAVLDFLKACPRCLGTGRLDADTNGFKALCPLCSPLRRAWHDGAPSR